MAKSENDVIAIAPAGEFRWRPIESAPQQGVIDIWAKRWVAKTDTFEGRRFADCFWRSTHFAGVPKEWKPTHWAPVIPPPTAY